MVTSDRILPREFANSLTSPGRGRADVPVESPASRRSSGRRDPPPQGGGIDLFSSLTPLKSLAGLAALTLAACSSLPVQHDAPDAFDLWSGIVLPPASSSTIRVGLETLPPVDGIPAPRSILEDGDRPRSEPPTMVTWSLPMIGPRPPTMESTRRLDELQSRWSLDRNEIRAKRSTIERITLRFLSELIGDDRKRVHRAIGAPLLGPQLRLSTDPLSNFLDEQEREDQQRQLTKNGTRMLRGPMRNSLKELPIFRDVEVTLHEIRDSNVQFTQKHTPGLGRISLRIHGVDPEDFIELVWIRDAIRVSASPEAFKASFSKRLAQNLGFNVHARYGYSEAEWGLFSDLEYRIVEGSTFHVLAGNAINILSGPTAYPGGPESEETSKGFLFYFEHLF